MERQVLLESVAAYDRIAPEFARISEDRRAYLKSIEQLVIAAIPPGARSLLDVGAGDGTRSLRIVAAAGIRDLVLLEPSAAMRANWPPGVRTWPIRAEQLAGRNGAFDVITCLWNVLGHIHPRQARVDVLRECRRLLSPAGMLLVDVNHRYNASHYGYGATLLRVLRDRFAPHEENGDVTARWAVDGALFATRGHVFTDTEFQRMVSQAGLAITKTIAVDYRTGKVRRFKYSGSLLYVLQRGTHL